VAKVYFSEIRVTPITTFLSFLTASDTTTNNFKQYGELPNALISLSRLPKVLQSPRQLLHPGEEDDRKDSYSASTGALKQ
jgi:hypothetical protein